MESKASLGRLEFCNFKLRTLQDFTLAINLNKSTDELMKMYEKLLRWSLNIGKVLIFAKNNGWNLILGSGISGDKYLKIDVEKDLLPFTEITMASAINNEATHEFDILLPIIHNQTAIAFVLVGDIDEEKDGLSPTIKHMQFVQTLTNIVIVAIENKRLFSENIEKERLHKEMELASEVQNMLIPDIAEFKQNKYLSVKGFYLPHFEIGGDYYDILQLNDHEVGFCIADVSGKGISAALLMSNFQANVRALFVSSIHLTDIVTILNERVIKSVKGEKFITLFIARYDYLTRELRYINAGHNPPILYNKETKELTYLESGCVGMGMVDAIHTIEEGHYEITGNSKLLCYTDGLVEINVEDEVSSTEKMVESCIKTGDSIDRSIELMIDKMEIGKSNTTIFDDITMLGLDFYINQETENSK
ncbi:MAG: serine/threonine protein phosphatase [Bacteroidetes bacterium]|nr:MAG: serine/threonine protein phosphatase [Bacteroidota bacterium]